MSLEKLLNLPDPQLDHVEKCDWCVVIKIKDYILNTCSSDLAPLNAWQMVLISSLWIAFVFISYEHLCAYLPACPSVHPSIHLFIHPSRKSESCNINAEFSSCYTSPNHDFYTWIIEINYIYFFFPGRKMQYMLFWSLDISLNTFTLIEFLKHIDK